MTTEPLVKIREILDILACPKCRGALTLVENEGSAGLDCAACAIIYPFTQEGIPVLLVESALPRDEWAKQHR